MKKLLFPLFAALLFTAGSASAQTTPTPLPAGQLEQPHASPEERAARQSQRLSQELGLSAEQTTRIQPIILGREQEMHVLRGQRKEGAGSRKQMGAQMKANRAKYEAQFKEVLTADQYAKFTQLEASGHAHGRGKGFDEAGLMRNKKGKTKVKTTES